MARRKKMTDAQAQAYAMRQAEIREQQEAAARRWEAERKAREEQRRKEELEKLNDAGVFGIIQAVLDNLVGTVDVTEQDRLEVARVLYDAFIRKIEDDFLERGVKDLLRDIVTAGVIADRRGQSNDWLTVVLDAGVNSFDFDELKSAAEKQQEQKHLLKLMNANLDALAPYSKGAEHDQAYMWYVQGLRMLANQYHSQFGEWPEVGGINIQEALASLEPQKVAA